MPRAPSLPPALIPARGPIRVLFSCVGRRVELVRAFRAAGKRLGRRLELWGTDRTWLAPAMHHVDRAVILPNVTERPYLGRLLELVKKRRIHLLVPLIDSELLLLAQARDRFLALGCMPLISSPRVVGICRDKLLSYMHLKNHSVDTPRTLTFSDLRRWRRPRFPLYLKPRAGSAARGHYLCEDRRELNFYAKRVPDPIIQEYVRGDEYSLDIYAGFDGRVRCVVPRLRLEVRGGEVSKGRTVKDRAIMAVGRRVVESFGGCIGVITIQCIRTPDGRIRVIEINPRFGGGNPLSIRAGADFPYWILRALCGRESVIRLDGFRDRLDMLRYDESVFCPAPRRR